MNFVTVSTVAAIVLSLAGVYFAWKQVQIARSTGKRHEDAALRDSPNSNGSLLLKRRTDVLADIRENRVLRVGCLWYPPFIEFTQQGEKVIANGLYPAMLDHVAAQSGLHIEYHILRWDIAIESVTHRQVDVVACVLQSGKRRERCDFCGTLYRVGVGGVVRADQKRIKRHEDLTNPELRIAVTKGEIGWEYAERYLNLKQGLLRFTIVEDTEITRMMNLVASRDVDVALADSLSCAQYIEHARADGNNLLDIFASFPLHVEENSLMIAKEQDDFKNWLSEALCLARSIPEAVAMEEQISKQWPGVLIKVPPYRAATSLVTHNLAHCQTVTTTGFTNAAACATRTEASFKSVCGSGELTPSYRSSQKRVDVRSAGACEHQRTVGKFMTLIASDSINSQQLQRPTATYSQSISYKPQSSTGLNIGRNLIRDQGGLPGPPSQKSFRISVGQDWW